MKSAFQFLLKHTNVLQLFLEAIFPNWKSSPSNVVEQIGMDSQASGSRAEFQPGLGAQIKPLGPSLASLHIVEGFEGLLHAQTHLMNFGKCLSVSLSFLSPFL